MNIVIIGGGFAGVWACLSAAVTLEKAAATCKTPVTIRLISDQENLTIRPRLYETPHHSMLVPLQPLLSTMKVELLTGRVTFIDAQKNQVLVATHAKGVIPATQTLPFDQLIIATGSALSVPQGLGLEGSDKVFSVDTYREAMRFEQYLQATTTGHNLPFVILGGGFTGIEMATELRKRLTLHGKDNDIMLVDANQQIGEGLGSHLQQPIANALQDSQVSTACNTRVVKLAGNELKLVSEGVKSGVQIDALILASGLRANVPDNNFASLANALEDRDEFGRFSVNRYLQLPDLNHVLMAGDTAKALAYEEPNHEEPSHEQSVPQNQEHYTYMSCQHAIPMGLVAGRNAALACLQQPVEPFRKSVYATCLDLGETGALFTMGWERQLQSQGNEAKQLKQQINHEWIRPPSPEQGKAGIIEFVEQGWQQIQ